MQIQSFPMQHGAIQTPRGGYAQSPYDMVYQQQNTASFVPDPYQQAQALTPRGNFTAAQPPPGAVMMVPAGQAHGHMKNVQQYQQPMQQNAPQFDDNNRFYMTPTSQSMDNQSFANNVNVNAAPLNPQAFSQQPVNVLLPGTKHPVPAIPLGNLSPEQMQQIFETQKQQQMNAVKQNASIVPPIQNFPVNTGLPGPAMTSNNVPQSARGARQERQPITIEYTDDSVVSQEDVEKMADIKARRSRGEKITKQESSFMWGIMTALGFGGGESTTNEQQADQSQNPPVQQTPMFGGIFGGSEPQQQFDFAPSPRTQSPSRQHHKKSEPGSPQARVMKDIHRASVVEDKYRVPIHQRSTFSRRMKSNNLESPACNPGHSKQKVNQVTDRLHSTTTATHRNKLTPRQLGEQDPNPVIEKQHQLGRPWPAPYGPGASKFDTPRNKSLHKKAWAPSGTTEKERKLLPACHGEMASRAPPMTPRTPRREATDRAQSSQRAEDAVNRLYSDAHNRRARKLASQAEHDMMRQKQEKKDLEKMKKERAERKKYYNFVDGSNRHTRDQELMAKIQNRDRMNQEQEMARQQKELEACTFKPKTYEGERLERLRRRQIIQEREKLLELAIGVSAEQRKNEQQVRQNDVDLETELRLIDAEFSQTLNQKMADTIEGSLTAHEKADAETLRNFMVAHDHECEVKAAQEIESRRRQCKAAFYVRQQQVLYNLEVCDADIKRITELEKKN